MCRFNNKGFSLIELMVVLAIVAVLLSLTGGLFQRNVAQQEKIVELEKVTQLFNKLSYKAYYGGGPYKVRFQENTITISQVGDDKSDRPGEYNEDYTELSSQVIEQFDFKQLIFVAQDYSISSKGVISPQAFSIIDKNNIKQFYFKAIFDEATQ